MHGERFLTVYESVIQLYCIGVRNSSSHTLSCVVSLFFPSPRVVGGLAAVTSLLFFATMTEQPKSVEIQSQSGTDDIEAVQKPFLSTTVHSQ